MVDIEYADPSGSHTKWTGKQCEKWLGARGLNKTGKAQEKRERVAGYLMSSSPPPEIISVKGCTVHTITNVIISLQAMISHIMSEDINAGVIHDMTRHIKIFLCMYERMDLIHRQSKKSSKVISLLS